MNAGMTTGHSDDLQTSMVPDLLTPPTSLGNPQSFDFFTNGSGDCLDIPHATSSTNLSAPSGIDTGSRKRRRPMEVTSSSQISGMALSKNERHGYNSSQDQFREVIQEQLPHLQAPPRKRSSSSSRNEEVDTKQQIYNTYSITKNHQSGPKRPRTAYIIFLEHFRQKYYEMFPNANFNECQKLAGKKWRTLSIVEKQPWKDEERLSHEEFIHKMHGLQSSFGLVNSMEETTESQNTFESRDNAGRRHRTGLEVPASYIMDVLEDHSDMNSVLTPGMQNHEKTDSRSTNSSKINELLRGPKNAFSIFVQAMREECQRADPNLTYNEIQKQLSGQWRKMSPDEKNIWVEKSNDIKRQLQEYNETLAAYGIDKDGNKNSELHKVKKGIQLPKGPRSAYTLFYQCARKQLYEARPELSFEEYPTICSKIWRDMPESEKALWKTDSINDKVRYEEELLALAQSDVAHTATSIVMEERLSKIKECVKKHEIENLNSTNSLTSLNHGASSYGNLLPNGDGENGPKASNVSPKKRRGKYKKKQVPKASELKPTSTVALSTTDIPSDAVPYVASSYVPQHNLLYAENNGYFPQSNMLHYPDNNYGSYGNAWVDSNHGYPRYAQSHDPVLSSSYVVDNGNRTMEFGYPPMISLEKNSYNNARGHFGISHDVIDSGVPSKNDDHEEEERVHSYPHTQFPHVMTDAEASHGHYHSLQPYPYYHHEMVDDQHPFMPFPVYNNEFKDV